MEFDEYDNFRDVHDITSGRIMFLKTGSKQTLLYRTTAVAFLYALFLAIASFSPKSCSAAIVEINVSGRIQEFDTFLGGPIHDLFNTDLKTGEPWSGVIRYDTDFPYVDDSPNPQMMYYSDPLRPNAFSILVNIHNHIFAGDNGLHAQVDNNITFDPNQVFQYIPGDSFSIAGPMNQSPFLLDEPSIGFSWNNPDGTALSSVGLPTNFNPFQFEQTISAGGGFSPIYIQINDAGGITVAGQVFQYSILAYIESAQVRVVPEPSAIALGFLSVIFIFLSISFLFVSSRELTTVSFIFHRRQFDV